MAKTGIFHHFGTFLLLASAILLLITTITAPVINDFSMLTVTLTNQSSIRNSSVTFGTFGFCVRDVADDGDKDFCTGKHIGYNPALEMARIESTDFSQASENTSKGLTRVMVLHPVACGMAFIAFLLALGAGVCGALFASFVSALTFIVALVVTVTDFVLFGIIKNHVNKDGSGSHAKFGVGIWTELAAMILLFFATFVVIFTCFSSRMHRKHDTKGTEAGYVNGTTTRRRFWQRKSRTTY